MASRRVLQSEVDSRTAKGALSQTRDQIARRKKEFLE
jgi:hypothetical protein